MVLSEEVPGLSGCTFTIEGVPKTGFAFTKTGNKLETGVDFRQELSNMFTWKNESETSRQRTKMESVRFPNSITPKTHVKVFIRIYYLW